MKKTFIYFCAVIGIILVLQSCATSTYSVHSATAVTEDEISLNVRVSPYLCDFEMIPKENPKAVYEEYNTNILVESIANNVDYWIKRYETIVKSVMMKKYNADAILSATSESKTNEKGELVITVRGYPIKYTNFRPATKEDAWMLKFDSTIKEPIIVNDLK